MLGNCRFACSIRYDTARPKTKSIVRPDGGQAIPGWFVPPPRSWELFLQLYASWISNGIYKLLVYYNSFKLSSFAGLAGQLLGLFPGRIDWGANLFYRPRIGTWWHEFLCPPADLRGILRNPTKSGPRTPDCLPFAVRSDSHSRRILSAISETSLAKKRFILRISIFNEYENKSRSKLSQ